MESKQAKYQRVAYYPGCALEGTGHAYNQSTKVVGKALGLELDEVKNWNCCGAMEVKNIDPKVQTYLSSRVMSIAAWTSETSVSGSAVVARSRPIPVNASCARSARTAFHSVPGSQVRPASTLRLIRPRPGSRECRRASRGCSG